MDVPRITGYRIESVTVPEPKDPQQIVREVMGLVPPAPRGPGIQRLRITLEGDRFPKGERVFNVSIGNQDLRGLKLSPDGRQMSALIDAVPSDGDQIAFHMPSTPEVGESGTLLAGRFETARLRIA
jgi:hypothetical protein